MAPKCAAGLKSRTTVVARLSSVSLVGGSGRPQPGKASFSGLPHPRDLTTKLRHAAAGRLLVRSLADVVVMVRLAGWVAPSGGTGDLLAHVAP